jgi:hypothetical protein
MTMTTASDSVLILDRAKNAQEVEFLLAYREADDAGKRRITKVLHAAARGELPTVEQANKMTHAEKIAFADSLPEVEA